MKRWNFVFLLFVIAENLVGQCKIDEKVFQEGEHLTYKAFFNWNFIWLEAADVWFDVGLSKTPGFYDLEAIGTSLPKYDWLYEVRDTFRARVNHETLLPYYSLRKTSEGSYVVDNNYNFDRKSNLLYTDTDNSDFGISKDTFQLQRCTFDVLSAIYYTRSLSFKGLAVNDTLPIRFIIDNEFFDLYIRYLGRETITTRYDDTYRCIKFSIKLADGTIFSGGEDMIVWATDDKNHIPVLVEAKIVLGSVKAFLTNIKNNKYPIEALVE